MGRALAKPIIQRRRPMMGIASLDPSYALMEWAEAIGFDAREAIKRLAKFPRK